MSPREQRLIVITLAVALPGLLYILGSLWSQGVDETAVSSAGEARFSSLLEKIENLERQKARNAQLRESMGGVEGGFAGELEISAAVAELEKAAGQSGVQIKGNSQSVNRRARPYPSLEIKVSAECEFPALIKFLEQLKKTGIVIQPQSIKAGLKNPNEPILDVQFTMATYLIGKQSPRADAGGGGAGS